MDDIGPTPAVIEDTPRTGRRTSRSERIEVITRGEGRRVWTLEQKRDVVLASLQPDVRPSDIARLHGINTGQLYTWRRQMLEGQLGSTQHPAPSFTRVDLADDQSALEPPPGQTSYGYDPYGVTGTSGAANTSSYQFTGREADTTGLYYNRARYYNPTWARFISEDPIGLRGGINRYGYARANPANFNDPVGLLVNPLPGGYPQNPGTPSDTPSPPTEPSAPQPQQRPPITVEPLPPVYTPPPTIPDTQTYKGELLPWGQPDFIPGTQDDSNIPANKNALQGYDPTFEVSPPEVDPVPPFELNASVNPHS